jgi:hypothetical protein
MNPSRPPSSSAADAADYPVIFFKIPAAAIAANT